MIASYDSAHWLPSTLSAVEVALANATMTAEVIVVDDGSTDGTAELLQSIASGFGYDLRVVRQRNQGRFLARWNGVEAAEGRYILLLDSRVLVDPDALRYLEDRLRRDPRADVWNGHVATDPLAPLVGRFWEVPTHAFWGHYLRAPRQIEITPENFDRVPKGTGFFFVPRESFRAAVLETWPEGDARLVSDDTRVLRQIVSGANMVLDPGFSALYRPRVTVGGFLRHARERGTLFVDSYAGTTVLRTFVLLGLVAAPIILAAVLVLLAALQLWSVLMILLGAVVVAVLVPLAVAGMNRAPVRALVSYLLFLVPFTACFWSGLMRGAVVHRRAFLPSAARRKGE